MAEIKQNTLFLTTSGTYINRDHLTLRVEFEKELMSRCGLKLSYKL